MKVENWCDQNGVTKENYYYHIRRVREACLLSAPSDQTDFIDVPVPQTEQPIKQVVVTSPAPSDTLAILHGPNGISIEVRSNASTDFNQSLIGALSYAK